MPDSYQGPVRIIGDDGILLTTVGIQRIIGRQ